MNRATTLLIIAFLGGDLMHSLHRLSTSATHWTEATLPPFTLAFILLIVHWEYKDAQLDKEVVDNQNKLIKQQRKRIDSYKQLDKLRTQQK